MFDKVLKQKLIFTLAFILMLMTIRCQAFAADSLQGADGYGDNWTFDQDVCHIQKVR